MKLPGLGHFCFGVLLVLQLVGSQEQGRKSYTIDDLKSRLKAEARTQDFARRKEDFETSLALEHKPTRRESKSRRQGGGWQCLKTTVPRPIIGECIEVFTRPVEYRACVFNQTFIEDRVPDISTRLSISDLSIYSDLSQAFVNQECRRRWQHWPTPPDFIYSCYGGTKEMEPCNGVDDYYTCTLGTCIRLRDRPDWPIDWWQRVEESQFGGYTPTLFDTRQWYCSDQPAYPLGTVPIGDIGFQTFYAYSSNPWIMQECDLVDQLGNDLPNADAQCQDVTADAPVENQCCGACMLANAHLMSMWNCTGLTTLVDNDFGIEVLAYYCKNTLNCLESRPCLGDPVEMGDPQVLLDPSTYAVQCDQLDSGCDSDGRCRLRSACDNTVEGLRDRLGYYYNSATGRLPSIGVQLIPTLMMMLLIHRGSGGPM